MAGAHPSFLSACKPLRLLALSHRHGAGAHVHGPAHQEAVPCIQGAILRRAPAYLPTAHLDLPCV